MNYTITLTRLGGQTVAPAVYDQYTAAVQHLKGLGIRLDSSAALIRSAARTGYASRTLATGASVAVEVSL